MINMAHLLVNEAPHREHGERVSVKEALDIRDSARKSNKNVSFLCPECKERARPHGGKVTPHGEHFPGESCERVAKN